jgi:hypothetical protein
MEEIKQNIAPFATQKGSDMKVLFVYWHGLGDNILATPAIKKYKQTTGNYVGWMMMERVKSAELFVCNPYIDELAWCSDAWHVAGHDKLKAGSKVVIEEAKKYAKENNYDQIIIIDHKKKTHKIHRTAEEMGVALDDSEIKTEFYYKREDIQKYYGLYNIPDQYVFFNGKAGLSSKDLPLDYVKKYMKNKNIDLPIISSDFTWDIKNVPIAFAADVMKNAKHRFLVDSVMYHIAHAMDLNVDLAYFKRGKRVWDVVKPLHSTKENIIYSLKA